MLKKTTTLFSCFMVILTGCTMPSQMTLLKGDASVNQMSIPEYIIEPGDVLQILFSSVNGDAAGPYNSAGTSYLVMNDGTISIPVIGKVQLAGKTQMEAKHCLSDLARLQVQDPIVHLNIANAVVTFLGEVASPSNISIVRPISFLEALGQVGGLTPNAKCNDVIVRRFENGQLHIYHVNLLTDEIYTSPCYYLLKGDVVYVAPLNAKRS